MTEKAAGAAALAGLGAGLRGAALAQQCSVAAAPSLTEGPYFVDEMLHRSDIRVDPTDNSIQEGFPLTLTLNLSRIDNCVITPLTGVFVDIWHCMRRVSIPMSRLTIASGKVSPRLSGDGQEWPGRV